MENSKFFYPQLVKKARFDDPIGQNEISRVLNLLFENQPDPTLNESIVAIQKVVVWWCVKNTMGFLSLFSFGVCCCIFHSNENHFSP